MLSAGVGASHVEGLAYRRGVVVYQTRCATIARPSRRSRASSPSSAAVGTCNRCHPLQTMPLTPMRAAPRASRRAASQRATRSCGALADADVRQCVSDARSRSKTLARDQRSLARPARSSSATRPSAPGRPRSTWAGRGLYEVGPRQDLDPRSLPFRALHRCRRVHAPRHPRGDGGDRGRTPARRSPAARSQARRARARARRIAERGPEVVRWCSSRSHGDLAALGGARQGRARIDARRAFPGCG